MKLCKIIYPNERVTHFIKLEKLEHCSDEEKAYVFSEVLPQASKLMNDVFGNYVIQKVSHIFFCEFLLMHYKFVDK